MSLAPVTEEQGLYEQKLPTILNEMLEHEEEHLFSHGAPAPSGEKKRRLKVEQVKALEKNFELENKLDPMKKLEIANELGLQPRQVAVWYQNRRARWKTKQLERDFAALRSNYDSLAADCNSLRRDRDALLAQIEELKAKLGETKKMKGGSSDSGEFDFNESLEWRVQRCFFAKEEEEEEEGFLAGEETCFDVFSEEQNPGFSWYGSDHGS